MAKRTLITCRERLAPKTNAERGFFLFFFIFFYFFVMKEVTVKISNEYDSEGIKVTLLGCAQKDYCTPIRHIPIVKKVCFRNLSRPLVTIKL